MLVIDGDWASWLTVDLVRDHAFSIDDEGGATVTPNTLPLAVAWFLETELSPNQEAARARLDLYKQIIPEEGVFRSSGNVTYFDLSPENILIGSFYADGREVEMKTDDFLFLCNAWCDFLSRH